VNCQKEAIVPDASPPFRRWLLGQRLRELRQALKLTGTEAAASAERSPSWLSRVEGGEIGLRIRELRDLLDRYGVTDARLRTELEQLAAEGRAHPWWAQYRDSLTKEFYLYLGYEAEATRLDWFGQAVIPGLLQTEDYARAIHKEAIPPVPDQLAEDRVAVRLRRQRNIIEEQQTPFTAMLSESVLRHQIGGAAVLRRQLDALLEAASRPSVKIHVVPASSGTVARVTADITIMSFAVTNTKIIYLEGPDGGRFEHGGSAETHVELFKRLQKSALGAGQTKKLIDSIRLETER
jgi:transcriptional regulator with XRE-family HTH domain